MRVGFRTEFATHIVAARSGGFGPVGDGFAVSKHLASAGAWVQAIRDATRLLPTGNAGRQQQRGLVGCDPGIKTLLVRP